MARGTAYATIAQYRYWNQDTQTGADAQLDLDLIGVSKWLDRDLSLMEGAFNTHTGTYYFGSNGGPLLTLEDTDGFGYFLQSVTGSGIGIDTEVDGTYDGVTLSMGSNFVIGQPENTATQPFTQIRLMPWPTATITAWPTGPRTVKITGTWGYAAVPDLIVQLTARLTRLTRDSHMAGAAQTIGSIDDLVRLPDAPKEVRGVWYAVKQAYGRKLFATTVSI